MSQSVGPLFDKQLTMSFPADIPVDLEGMFRRGPQWETGVEHIFVVETSSGSDEEAALEYVGQLSEVATTPLAGALQSSVGLVQQEIANLAWRPSSSAETASDTLDARQSC